MHTMFVFFFTDHIALIDLSKNFAVLFLRLEQSSQQWTVEQSRQAPAETICFRVVHPCRCPCVRACVRDSRGSFMFPRYLQYLLMDFRQTFVAGASWDTDELIRFWGHGMTECIPDFHVSTISRVSIDRFSPNFCHWCILGLR